MGFAQALALIPGTSRSGATIIGGLFFGLSRKAATEFSFFLAIPTLFAATVYEVVKYRDLFHADDLGMFAGRFGRLVHQRLSVRALAAALHQPPRFHGVRLVSHRVRAGGAGDGVQRPGELVNGVNLSGNSDCRIGGASRNDWV